VLGGATAVIVVAWINTWEHTRGEAGLADFLFCRSPPLR
jgi:hypothetical protein